MEWEYFESGVFWNWKDYWGYKSSLYEGAEEEQGKRFLWEYLGVIF